MTYQTFDPSKPGDSDSPAKWDALKLSPATWGGASVLDLGCNTGYFCRRASDNGARLVVGIDRDRTFADVAIQNCPDCEIIRGDWSCIEEYGVQFDITLMLSAFHYADDPEATLSLIHRQLKPSGLFVLECGIAPGLESKWVVTARGPSVVRHPTMSLMLSLLDCAGFVARYIGRSVDQAGDPMPRHVFHCRKRSRQLLIVSGESGAGKSSLVRDLETASFSVDTHLRDWLRHSGQKVIPDAQHDCLQVAYQALAADWGKAREFAESIISCLPPYDCVTVDCIDLLAQPLREAAQAAGYRVWIASHAEASV